MENVNFFECIPWNDDKDLIKAYNDFMELLPDDGWAVFKDADAMWLDPFYGLSIKEAIKNNPDTDCFTCLTNRIGNPIQLYNEYNGDDIKIHRQISNKLKTINKNQCPIFELNIGKVSVLSGVVIILSKKGWEKIGGFKEWKPNYSRILGVDNKLHLDLVENNLNLRLIKSLYVYHWYRGGGTDKSHLN